MVYRLLTPALLGGAEGGHRVGERLLAPSGMGQGGGGGQQGIESPGWEGRDGTHTGTVHRFLQPRARMCSEWGGMQHPMGWRGGTAPRAGAHLCWGRVWASLGCNIVAGGEGAQGCAVIACVIVW